MKPPPRNMDPSRRVGSPFLGLDQAARESGASRELVANGGDVDPRLGAERNPIANRTDSVTRAFEMPRYSVTPHYTVLPAHTQSSKPATRRRLRPAQRRAALPSRRLMGFHRPAAAAVHREHVRGIHGDSKGEAPPKSLRVGGCETGAIVCRMIVASSLGRKLQRLGDACAESNATMCVDVRQ